MVLRIAIQSKGRLHEETMSLLSESGIKLNNKKKTLLVPAEDFPVEILFLRDDDIPEVVATGVADIGIVGENEFVEKQKNGIIVKRLGFGKCRLSLAIPKDKEYKNLSWFNRKKIATSYPCILDKYLSNNNIQAEIHEINGSVEISPSIGLADAIFDIVSSGGTLVSNRLKEVQIVMYSEALLIKNDKLPQEKERIIKDLLFRIDAAQIAQGKKYVLLNIHRSKLSDIVKLLPGMKSPTVTQLAESDWCSVQSVIEEKKIWEVVSKLKTLGAEDILVLPIEKMIL